MAQRKIVTQIPWKYQNKLQLFTMEQLKTMIQVWFFGLFIRFLNVNKQQLRSLLDLIMLAIYFVFMINMLKFIFASLIHPSYNHSLACQSMLSKLPLLRFFSVSFSWMFSSSFTSSLLLPLCSKQGGMPCAPLSIIST